jgi:uncharacterized protein with FMN-binding domain
VSSESKPSLERDSINRPVEPSGDRGQWLKSNLVSLGSAAVLAVYAAGFERTKAAAARFNDESAGRRRAAPIRTTGEIGALTPRAPAPATPAPAPATAAKPAVPPTRTATDTTPKPSVAASHTTVSHAAEPGDKPTAEPTIATAAPTPSRDSTSAPKIVEAPAAATKPTPAAPAPDTTPAEKASVRKDGTYSGWGTSRHGDIQATVQIRDGKIVFAAITECLTRYSCSWIAALPPQVLTRQSPDVDFVSGATESTNAFYYAVVEALKKAQ